MRSFKLGGALAIVAVVSACSAPEFVSRRAASSVAPGPEVVAQSPSFAVEGIKVYVDPNLVVSEANGYYPGSDIVWRGEPFGDRHQQVRRIFEDAFARGTSGLRGDQPIILQVDVRRFHALTERARYTTGGVHAITFALQKRDAATGATIGEAKLIRADLRAYGGKDAIVADQIGQTQKVRITDHLARVIEAELTEPDGYSNERLGAIQALNQL